MAKRWQIMKRTNEGVFRATTDTEEGLEEIVKIAQSDPETKWIVVKDRYLNRRGLVWKRSQGEEIDWWCLDPETPEIKFKKTK
jgi:hypothetical protein